MAKDPLSYSVGMDLSVLHPTERRDGVMEIRGRNGVREVEGQYDPAIFNLTYRGRDEAGGGIVGDLRGKSHKDMAAPFQSLIAWLRGQDEPPAPQS